MNDNATLEQLIALVEDRWGGCELSRIAEPSGRGIGAEYGSYQWTDVYEVHVLWSCQMGTEWRTFRGSSWLEALRTALE